MLAPSLGIDFWKIDDVTVDLPRKLLLLAVRTQSIRRSQSPSTHTLLRYIHYGMSPVGEYKRHFGGFVKQHGTLWFYKIIFCVSFKYYKFLHYKVFLFHYHIKAFIAQWQSTSLVNWGS